MGGAVVWAKAKLWYGYWQPLSKRLMPAHPRAPSTIVFMPGHCLPTPPQETPKHTQASLAQSPVGSLLLSPRSWCAQGPVCDPKSLFLQSRGISAIKSHWPPKWNSLGVLRPFAGSPSWEIHCGSQNYHQRVNTKIRFIIFFEAKDGEAQ